MVRSLAEGAATALGSSKTASAGDAVACTLFEMTAHRPMGGVSLDWVAMLSVARATEDTEEKLSSPPTACWRPSIRALAGILNGAGGISDLLL